MLTKYEVTTTRLTRKGRIRRTRVVVAERFTQTKSTARFFDQRGGTVARIKHVIRICWP